MKGKLVKIYGMRDPVLEAKRMEIIKLLPPDAPWPEVLPLDDLYECIMIPPKRVRLRSKKYIVNFSGPVTTK